MNGFQLGLPLAQFGLYFDTLLMPHRLLDATLEKYRQVFLFHRCLFKLKKNKIKISGDRNKIPTIASDNTKL